MFRTFIRAGVPCSRASSTMPLRAKILAAPPVGRAGMATAVPAAAPVPREKPGDNPEDVLFNSLFGVRHVELNRPKALNALDASMARKIPARLLEYEKSDIANVIIVSGAGDRAFCAGGDVVALARAIREKGDEGREAAKEFFKTEYQLDQLIANYTKPYIAILDGYTMGGGVGMSVHAPFRIATEKTVFAMPETRIGFFPDVGASFFLPRMDGALGTYLALTSERLTADEVFYSGIATHYINSTTLASLVQRLSELVFHDRTTLDERLDIVNRTMAEFHTGFPDDTGKPSVVRGSLRKSVDRCFSSSHLEEIMKNLEQETENKEWAQKTLKTMQERSPTSLKVALRQMTIGKDWTITQAFQREEKIARQMMDHPDFVTGVSALLIDKSKERPAWQPSTVAELKDEDVDHFFAVPEGESLMPLLKPNSDYKDYPHQRFALPRETAIREVVNSGLPRNEVIRHFLNITGRKQGVRTKVEEVLARKTKPAPHDRLEWIE